VFRCNVIICFAAPKYPIVAGKEARKIEVEVLGSVHAERNYRRMRFAKALFETNDEKKFWQK